MIISSDSVGSRVTGTSSAATARAKPVFSTTSSSVTPGCSDSSRTVSPATLDVEDAEVGDDPVDVVVLRRAGPAAFARSGPTPETMSTLSTKTRVLCFGTQYDVRLFTVLPGAPREPSSWRLGCAKSPIAEMFWLPCRSTWVAPIITCRLP